MNMKNRPCGNRKTFFKSRYVAIRLLKITHGMQLLLETLDLPQGRIKTNVSRRSGVSGHVSRRLGKS